MDTSECGRAQCYLGDLYWFSNLISIWGHIFYNAYDETSENNILVQLQLLWQVNSLCTALEHRCSLFVTDSALAPASTFNWMKATVM